LYGTEEQKQKYVPKLASGEWFGSYCLTEPGAGSDANSGKTKAVLSADGTHYLISGQKMWISNAGFCNVMIVFARIEEDKNITGFIVEYDRENTNGITLGEEEHKLGIRASSTRQVFFNETKVPVEKKRMSWKTPAAVSIFVLLAFIVVQIVISNSNSSTPSVVDSTPVATASPTASPTAVESESPTAENTVSPVVTGVKMEISATRGNSRIHIVSDGKTLEKGPLFQGETRSFEASTSISIYFSNPAGLDVTVNGELLAPLGGQNEEVRRTFR
jgi:hypothetical protein